MISIVQVQELGDDFERKLQEADASILDDFPVNNFIDTFSLQNDMTGYLYFNEASRNIHTSIKKNYPTSVAVDYHCLFLLRFIEKSLGELNPQLYPASIIEYFNQHFERTFKRIQSNIVTLDWLDFNQDKFSKEFSVVRLQMIPVGPQIIVMNKLSFRMFLRHGIVALLKGMYCVFFATKGLKPIYELHTNHIDPILMKYFNKEGWHHMFMNLAELMEKNKSIKAIFGVAWFFDPVLNQVSPDIAYINQYATEAGACFIRAKTRPIDTKDALFMNSARKKLYEEGKYIPARYLVIIPRKRLINWSKHQKQL